MGALAVVERFNVIEDLPAGLGAGGKAMAIDQFQFEGGPEAFHGGVVITVAAAAHGGELTALPADRCIVFCRLCLLDVPKFKPSLCILEADKLTFEWLINSFCQYLVVNGKITGRIYKAAEDIMRVR